MSRPSDRIVGRGMLAVINMASRLVLVFITLRAASAIILRTL